jgi:hypothetical protein
MTPGTVIRHRNGTVQTITADGCVTELPGLPPLVATTRDDQAEIAASLGYGADVAAMNREHDLTHAMVADWLGFPASWSLTAAAGGDVPAGLAEAEEAAAMAVQRLMRLAGAEWL